MDLCRPYDYQGWWGAAAVGRASFYSWARGHPAVPRRRARLRPAGTRRARRIWPAFVLAALLAVGLGFAWGFLVQLTAFWITDVRGPNQLAWIGAGFLSGMFSTIVLFPAWLEAVARALPFAAMVQLPAEVFLGKHRGLELLARARSSRPRGWSPSSPSAGWCWPGPCGSWWCSVAEPSSGAPAELAHGLPAAGRRPHAGRLAVPHLVLPLPRRAGRGGGRRLPRDRHDLHERRRARRLVGGGGGAPVRPVGRVVRARRPAHQPGRERVDPDQGTAPSTSS